MVKTRYGASSLHLAASNGHEQIVRLLLESGVDVNAVANHNSTALHWAVSKGNESTVRLLLEKGADTEANISYDGKAPLLFTRKSFGQIMKDPEYDAGNDGEEISEGLLREYTILDLKMGEHHHIHAKDECTALQVAANEGHDEIVRLLKAARRDTAPLQGRRISELGEESDGDNSTRPTKKRKSSSTPASHLNPN
jgi:ankyrin repeat protein